MIDLFLLKGFSSFDYCCRRACVPNDQCGENYVGCKTSDDCFPGFHSFPSSHSSSIIINFLTSVSGLQCMIDAEQPYCADVDECNDERADFNKLDVQILFSTLYCRLH